MTTDLPDLVLYGGRVLVDQTDRDWVAVTAGTITGLGTGTPPAAREQLHLEGDWLAPGFVDVHVHGGGGGDFMSEDPAARRMVRQMHARHGTTSLLASTVSRPAAELRAAVSRLAEDAESGSGTTQDGPDQPLARLLGIHLEGPYLSRVRRGAHEETALRPPDVRELEELLDAGRGWVRTLTLAPELPGALELLRFATASDVVVSVGHTDADADTIRAAVDAGASSLTHTFNCMRPLHHRRPGAVGMAMDLPELTCELILDLVHVDAVAARALVHAAGAERVCLITDAMAAAGMAQGRYQLGGSEVDVADGQVHVAGTDTLAGSTLTMAQAVANAVAELRVDVPTAAAMAAAVPARMLGLEDAGNLRVGAPADLVRLDERGRLRAVWIAGRSVPQHTGQHAGKEVRGAL